MSSDVLTPPGIAKRMLASWLHTPTLSAGAKKFFWRSYYSAISRRQDGLETMLLNYGYAADDAAEYTSRTAPTTSGLRSTRRSPAPWISPARTSSRSDAGGEAERPMSFNDLARAH